MLVLICLVHYTTHTEQFFNRNSEQKVVLFIVFITISYDSYFLCVFLQRFSCQVSDHLNVVTFAVR